MDFFFFFSLSSSFLHLHGKERVSLWFLTRNQTKLGNPRKREVGSLSIDRKKCLIGREEEFLGIVEKGFYIWINWL